MRVRIRRLPMDHWAVEYKKWPWSFWREEDVYMDRTTDEVEAVKRAETLIHIFHPVEVLDQ